ncbi:AaceriABL192Cp [[Ashbya] aceris (nom. inval.)]|nr:AaceriABL192Cp [[Ashbya] aceris (nom. inval.)]
MAKRHKHYENRGSARRGRRGGRGGHRGRGSRRNYGERTNSERDAPVWAGSGDLGNPDMVDDYYFGRQADRRLWKKDSMRMGGFRPGDMGVSEQPQSNLPARKRPVTFMLAQDVYDPSHNLEQLLNKKTSRDAVEEGAENGGSPSASGGEEPESDEEPVPERKVYRISELEDNALFFVDEQGRQPTNIPAVAVAQPEPPRSVEFNDTLTVGKVQLQLRQNSDGETFVDAPHAKLIFRDEPYGDISEDEDKPGRPENELLGKTMNTTTVQPSSPVPQLLSTNIGRLTLSELAPDTESESGAPAATPEDTKPEGEPEFGFLDEDYAADMSEVHVTNIRLGAAAHSYFVSSPKTFGDSISRWVDHDTMTDLALELGLPEGRLPAYLRHVYQQLVPPEEPAEDVDDGHYDDENYDDSEDEEEGDDYDDEGLKMLVQHTLAHDPYRNRDYDTKSLEYRGHGSRKRLVIEEESMIDGDIRTLLEDKAARRSANRAAKRHAKEDYIAEEARTSSDLFRKYPYGFHIENIIDEFQAFLVSPRAALEFPPLDPHGRRTLKNLAAAFALVYKQVGQSTHTHVLVQKGGRREPDYDAVNRIRHQRRVFMRVDVRRPRDEDAPRQPRAKFHVREGAIVGGDAPSIGQDNVGRRLLEKLGWTHGEGLGIHGNKGISEPLMARVKKNRSGLRYTE